MLDYGFKEGFLEEGSVVIFPTDTVYGIGCMLYDNKAINRIFEIKDRSHQKHLAVLCDTLVSVNDIGIIDERALKLAHAFWPGALTMVLNASEKYFNKTKNITVGIRIPNHKFALQLIKQNGPLIATSVNKSGEKPLVRINNIVKEYNKKVDYIFKESDTKYLDISSTTIDLTGDEVKLIREGSITLKEIEEVLKK